MNRGLAGVLALALCAGVANGQNPPTKDFTVGEGSKLLVPLAAAPRSGTTVTLKEHQPALIAGLAFEAGAIMPEERGFTAGGIDWIIPAGNRMLKMTGWSGGDSAAFPAGSSVWCELARREPRKAKPKPDKPEMDQLKRSFEERVMVCAVDDATDGTFDRAFVTGAKVPDQRRAVPIDPLPYKPMENIRLPSSGVAVRFHHQNIFHTPRFYVEGVFNGNAVEVWSLGFFEPQGTIQTALGSINTPPKDLPLTLRYGGGKFTIEAIDGKTKTARVRIDSAWDKQPVLITRTVYAY